MSLRLALKASLEAHAQATATRPTSASSAAARTSGASRTKSELEQRTGVSAKGRAKLEVRYGHVVMVKLPGYPNWPAKLVHPADVDDADLTSDPQRKGAYLAYFFGPKNYAWVKSSQIRDNFAESEPQTADRYLLRGFEDARKWVADYSSLIAEAAFATPEGSVSSSSAASKSTAAGKRKRATNKAKSSRAAVQASETDRLAQVLSSLVDSDSGSDDDSEESDAEDDDADDNENGGDDDDNGEHNGPGKKAGKKSPKADAKEKKNDAKGRDGETNSEKNGNGSENGSDGDAASRLPHKKALARAQATASPSDLAVASTAAAGGTGASAMTDLTMMPQKKRRLAELAAEQQRQLEQAEPLSGATAAATAPMRIDANGTLLARPPEIHNPYASHRSGQFNKRVALPNGSVARARATAATLSALGPSVGSSLSTAPVSSKLNDLRRLQDEHQSILDDLLSQLMRETPPPNHASRQEYLFRLARREQDLRESAKAIGELMNHMANSESVNQADLALVVSKQQSLKALNDRIDAQRQQKTLVAQQQRMQIQAAAGRLQQQQQHQQQQQQSQQPQSLSSSGGAIPIYQGAPVQPAPRYLNVPSPSTNGNLMMPSRMAPPPAGRVSFGAGGVPPRVLPQQIAPQQPLQPLQQRPTPLQSDTSSSFRPLVPRGATILAGDSRSGVPVYARQAPAQYASRGPMQRPAGTMPPHQQQPRPMFQPGQQQHHTPHQTWHN